MEEEERAIPTLEDFCDQVIVNLRMLMVDNAPRGVGGWWVEYNRGISESIKEIEVMVKPFRVKKGKRRDAKSRSG
jgi:hypothetical protein